MPDDLISQAAYARRVGISAQLLAHHIRVGNVAVHGEQRRISIGEADAALREIIKAAKIPGKAAAKAVAVNDAPKVLTLHEARAERARHDAVRSALAKEKEELELGLMRRSMVPLAEVEKEWSAALGILRARLIAIPAKIAPGAAAERDPVLICKMIEEEIWLALNELSGRSEAAARG